MKRLALKVCGLREAENIASIAALEPDFLGFVFAKDSPRFVADETALFGAASVPRVGVFVDDTVAAISERARRCELSVLQLHGRELPEEVSELRRAVSGEVKIWKALSIRQSFPESELEKLIGMCEAFLFDAAGPSTGGNGQLFNWEVIPLWVRREIPFFLSGGIGIENLSLALEFARTAPAMLGIDVNSKVERDVKGEKDSNLVRDLKRRMLAYGT